MLSFAAGLALGAGVAAAAAWLLARRRNRTLGRFFSFAAHEINTPITAINMTILNLLSGVFGPLPPDQSPWVEMMREQLTRLNGMVGEMRDLIHIELNKRLDARVEEASSQDVVEAAARAVRHGLTHAGIELTLEIPEGLPTLKGDPDRVTRTLISLLFHARKFRLAGPISLSARAQGAFVEFVVRYHGPALAAAEAARSLDLYYPATRHKENSMTATGLGLGILRLVLRRQGGDLALLNDQGATALTARILAAGGG